MKKYLILFPVLVAFLIGFANGPAMASTYYLWNDWGGTWYDAEKSPSNYDDDLMCWAASAANILYWAGWTDGLSVSFDNVDDVFAYFQDHWSDEGGNAYYGWDWWFDGTNNKQGVSGWSQVEVAGGGFYDTYDFNSYYVHNNNDGQAMAQYRINTCITDMVSPWAS